MADIVLQRDVGSLGSLLALSAAATAVAAGSGDSASTTGITIDRMSGGGVFGAAELAVMFGATLASGKTLSIGYDLQEGPDGANWSDFQTATYAVVATGPSGGGVVNGQLQIGANLRSARRYVRLNFAIDLSATGTDTATALAAGFLAGNDRLPQGPG